MQKFALRANFQEFPAGKLLRNVRIQRVQTVIFFLPFGVSRCTVCRLGFTFLGVLPLTYILSWATLFPNTVVFPQISQRIFSLLSLSRKPPFFGNCIFNSKVSRRETSRSSSPTNFCGKQKPQNRKVENLFSTFFLL